MTTSRRFTSNAALVLSFCLVHGCAAPPAAESGPSGAEDVVRDDDLADDDCVIVPRPQATQMAVMDIQGVARTSEKQSYELELSGRGTLWIHGGITDARFQMVAGKTYELRLSKVSTDIVAQLLDGQTVVWEDKLLQSVYNNIKAPPVAVRPGLRSDSVDFYWGAYLVTVEFSTSRP